MRYIELSLAYPSTKPEDKEENETWNKVYPLIVNKNKADEDGYFWAVKEAAIVKEGSAVIAGSNSVTPYTLQRKNNEPEDSTHLNNKAAVEDTATVEDFRNIIKQSINKII